MRDELDEALERERSRQSTQPHRTVVEPHHRRVARLVSRVYGAAGGPLRARMLACLLRPLGSLGLMAVASGAFAQCLHRSGEPSVGRSLDDLGCYSNEQIVELVRFVEQVSPAAIQQLASLFADGRVDLAAFGASAAMLLVRAVRSTDPNVGSTGPAGSSGRRSPSHGVAFKGDDFGNTQ